MKNQQGAPDALRHADGLESFAQMLPAYGFNPQPLKDAASELRRLAALVEAQQPAPSAAAATEAENLRKALQFYADKEHFNIADDGAWDTVSGEPQNYWCDEEGTATVEDGTIARLALAGHQLKFDADEAPQPSPTPQADSAPTSGNWVSADDVNRLVRELDVALNGEAGAAAQASLCDVVAQVRHEAAKRGQPPQENVALLADILNRRPALNAGLVAAYTHWTREVYDLMGAMAAEPANDALAASAGNEPVAGAMWKLVPVEPTPKMIETAQEAHMPFGDMQLAIQLAIAAAPQAPARSGEPVGRTHASWITAAKRDGGGVFAGRQTPGFDVPLYIAPQPAAREPLTDDAIVEAFCSTPGLTPRQMVGCFVAGARFAERAHCITKH